MEESVDLMQAIEKPRADDSAAVRLWQLLDLDHSMQGLGLDCTRRVPRSLTSLPAPVDTCLLTEP